MKHNIPFRQFFPNRHSFLPFNFRSAAAQNNASVNNLALKCQSDKIGRFILTANISTTSNYLKEQSNYSPSYYCNMNSQHFTAGSKCPPIQDGKLRIYSMRFCPYAQRAILVALAKDIKHDVVNCNLKEKADWLLQRNPYGKVPVLELPNSDILYESLVVAEYLNDAYPERPLHSPDPYLRALDRLWIERFNKSITSFYRIVFAIKNGNMEKFDVNVESFGKSIESLGIELQRRQTKFFSGQSSPGMLDYMIWPWFERLPSFMAVIPSELLKNFTNLFTIFKQLGAWETNMREDFAVKEFLLPIEVHTKFLESFIAGAPNYNILESKL